MTACDFLMLSLFPLEFLAAMTRELTVTQNYLVLLPVHDDNKECAKCGPILLLRYSQS